MFDFLFGLKEMPFPTPNFNLDIVSQTTLWFYENNPVLQDLQVGVENDSGLFKIGNGVDVWNDLGYALQSQPSGVWVGKSAAPNNLLDIVVGDGGFHVNANKFNGNTQVTQAFDGVIADLANYTSTNQQLAGYVAAGLLMKKIVAALGSLWVVTSSSGAPATTVSQKINSIENSLSSLSSGLGAIINDGAASGSSTFSSTKINQLISTSISNLVGSAPGALDTIYELATALQNNPNVIANLLTEVSNTVKTTSQTLTGLQKNQARVNIGAADATVVGLPADNATSLAEKYAAEKAAAGATAAATLPTTLPPIVKTRSFTAKPIGQDGEGIYGIDLATWVTEVWVINNNEFFAVTLPASPVPGMMVQLVNIKDSWNKLISLGGGGGTTTKGFSIVANGSFFLGDPAETTYYIDTTVPYRSFFYISHALGWYPM